MREFEDFPFHPRVAAGIDAAGYVTPTPIQLQAIPPVLEGRDVMGLAQTGTGKTAAFVLPILNRLMKGRRGSLRALIVAPVRELAEQIHEAIGVLGRNTGLTSATVYGGVNIRPQIRQLHRGVDILVACPGRLLDHVGRGTIDLRRLQVLVLDEADHMFDMGFLPDIRRIVSHVPAKRQTLMFSATMPREIERLAGEALVDPVTVKVGRTAPAETVSHALYPVSPHQKNDLLMELLRQTEARSVLVFTRTKHRAKSLAMKLARAGHRATSLQGNLSQSQRQTAMEGFRSGRFKVLVATDIAARGIDVTRVSHVINYDIPDTSDAYLHRIGRTGRATSAGDAFTIVTGEDHAMVRSIERLLGEPLERVHLDGFEYQKRSPQQPAKAGKPARPPFGAAKTRPARPGRKPGGSAPWKRGSKPRRGRPSGART